MSITKPIDRDEIKSAASGRWSEIIESLTGISHLRLTAKSSACPLQCNGGDDRYSPFDDFNETGGVVCRHCGTNPDGFATIMKATGWGFAETLRRVAEHLGMTETSSEEIVERSPQVSVKKVSSRRSRYDRPQEMWQLILSTRSSGGGQQYDEHLASWCRLKQGLTLKVLQQCEAVRLAVYRAVLCIAFITQHSDGRIQGVQYCQVDGQPFGAKKKRKTLTHKHSRDSWFFPSGRAFTLAARTIVRCEGPTDAIALTAILPAGWAAFSSLCGAASCPRDDIEWQRQADRVFVLFDSDVAGRDGGTKFIEDSRRSQIEVIELRLPGDNRSNGYDVRDWVADGATTDDLLALVDVKCSNQFQLINCIQSEEQIEPFTLAQISKRLNESTGNWPKVCDGELFAYDAEKDQVRHLKKPSQLFAWAGSVLDKSSPPDFNRAACCHTKEEFLEHLLEHQDRYDAIETIPHEPPVDGCFYAHPPLPESSGDHLNRLLDRFNVATEYDRELITAMLLTLFWGGMPGARPIFLVSADGVGSGKTTMAKVGESLVGGSLDVQPKDAFDIVKTRLLSPAGRAMRMCLADNLRGFRLSHSEIEAIVTAQFISGRQNYKGEGRRKNLLCWIFTSNSPGFSRDLAQRVINIQLRKPEKYIASWESDTFAYLNEYRSHIIADLISILQSSRLNDAPPVTRWATWEREILCRLPNTSDLQKLIERRQQSLDCDSGEAKEFEAYVGNKISKYYDDEATVFLPNELIRQWWRAQTGDSRIRPQTISATVVKNIDEGLITKMQQHRFRSCRGFVWQGSNSEDMKTDIETRLSERIQIR